MSRVSIAFLALITAAAGCGPRGAGCTEGQTVACTCSVGRTGTQTCRADGWFDPCVCTTPDGGPVDDASVADASADDAAAPVDAPMAPTPILDFDAAVGVTLTASGEVLRWADGSGAMDDAVLGAVRGPVVRDALVDGVTRPVLHFDGESVLVAPPHVPPSGTLVIVFGNENHTSESRVIDWGTDETNLAISPDTMATDVALFLARDAGVNGDVVGGASVREIECDVITWGAEGTTVERHLASGAVLRLANGSLHAIGDGGRSLAIGAASVGAGTSMAMTGDVAALRVYDVQLDEAARDAVADELF